MVEGYWDSDRQGVAVNDVDWSEAGNEGIYFLHLMDGESTYRLTNSYGRLLYPRGQSDQVDEGPSGVDPYDGTWKRAEGDLGDLDDATEYVAALADQP